jgi:hypothetical protein
LELYGIEVNAKLNNWIQVHAVVRFVKAQRIRWPGHEARMLKKWTPKATLKGRLFSRRRNDHVQDGCTMW